MIDAAILQCAAIYSELRYLCIVILEQFIITFPLTILKAIFKLLLSFFTMSTNFLQTAINAALAGDWQKAISANQSLLKDDKNDINTISRLAHAYTQIGKLDEAKKLYKKILTIDKYNLIAQKKMERLGTVSKGSKPGNYSRLISPVMSPSLFIEEPGKTKTISLLNTAPANKLSRLNPGESVLLCPKRHSIEIRTLDKNYIGVLPDDFAFRLLKFIKAGYDYEVFVKNATKNCVNIFIKEVKRAKRFKSQPSFLTAGSVPSRHAASHHDRKPHDLSDEDEEETEKHQEEAFEE